MRNIAIEIGKDRLWLAAGASHAGKAQLEQLATADLGDDQAAGAVLADLVKSRGLRGNKCTAVVRRGDVEIRTTELPTTTLSELPDMVRFATSRLFASASENWPIDFLILPEGSEQTAQTDHGTTSVLAAAISPGLVNRLRSICHDAGLELQSIVLAPVEVANCTRVVGDAAAQGGTTLLLEPLLNSTELTTCIGGRVASVRSVRSPLDGDEDSLRDLAGEIRRTSLAAGSGDSQPRLLLLGGTMESAAALGEASGAMVERIPLSELATTQRLKPDDARLLEAAGVSGVIAALANGHRPVGKLGPSIDGSRLDFLDPRRYIEPPRSHVKLVAIGSSIAALLLVGMLAYWQRSRNLDSEIAQLQSEIQTGKATVDSAELLLANQETIRGFVDRRANWLEQLAYLSAKALPAEQMIVGDVDATTPPVAQNGVIATRVAVSERGLGPEVERTLRDADHSVAVSGWNRTSSAAAIYNWVGDVRITVPLKDETAWLAPVAPSTPEAQPHATEQNPAAEPASGDLADNSEGSE